MSNEQQLTGVDLRMHDFVEGCVFYAYPTENIESKLTLLANMPTDMSRVVTVVGGNWPKIFAHVGATEITALDINQKQIDYLTSETEKYAELSELSVRGRLRIGRRSITDLDTSDPKLLAQTTLLELTNVFDYYSPRTRNERIAALFNALPEGSVLSLSSQKFGIAEDVYKMFQELGTQVKFRYSLPDSKLVAAGDAVPYLICVKRS